MAFRGSEARLRELLTVDLTSPMHFPEPHFREREPPSVCFLYYGEMDGAASGLHRLLRCPGLQKPAGNG